ncbi:MAG: PAS domain S-box protein [bacterium]
MKKTTLLRKKAEELINKKFLKTNSLSFKIGKEKLIEELTIHQIELELQNEELILANENALIASEKYTKLYDYAPTGYISLSKVGEIIELNYRMAQILGQKREQLINSRFGFFITIETRPSFNLFLEKLYNSKIKESCEVMLSINNSSSSHVLLEGILCENEEQCFLTVTDITEWKQIEEALMESEARLKTEEAVKKSANKWQKTFDGIRDSVMLLDSSGKILNANKTTQSIFGKEEEIVGRYCYEIVNLTEYYNDNCPLIKIKLHKKRETVLLFVGNKWFEFIFDPILDEKNEINSIVHIISDVTERKQAEELLRESRDRNRALLKANPDMIFLIDKNGTFLDYSAESDTLLYSPPEFFIGKNITDILPPKVAELLNHNLRKVLQSGLTQICEYQLELNDKTKHFETRLVLCGETGILSIVRDITDRKRVELERQILSEIIFGITTTSNLEELLKLIHQSLKKVVYAENFFVALYNHKTGFFSFPYFVDKFDISPEPLKMEKSCTSYVFNSGKTLILSQELFEKLVKQNKVELVGSPSQSWVGIPLQTAAGIIGVLVIQHYEMKNVYRDNDVKFLESIANQIAGIIELKLAEKALYESEINFKGLFNSVLEAIYIQDENGVFIDVNEGAVKMYGYEREYFIGKDPSFISAPNKNDLAKVTQAVKKAFNGENQKFEYWGLKKNGEIFPKEVSLYKGKYFGKDVIIAVAQDITERKQAELIIRDQNLQLKELNAAKDKFFSIIAHDLRSPFQGFLGITQLLAENISSFTQEELSSINSDMYRSASNLYKLLQNLLEWSRMQRGLVDFTLNELNIYEIVTQNVANIEQSAMLKKIEIIIEVAENQKVYADENMINSVIRNLLSNAVKFSNKYGKIIIRVKELKDQFVEISVQDYGIGMSKDVQKKLFKIDEKVNRIGTYGESSTGLGLLLCKEFVDKHGGKIWTESEEEIGSTFYFTIKSQTNH